MFLHALCFKHMFYRHFMYSAFLGRGNGIGLHPGSRQVGLCHHHSLGKGARTAPAPCTGERASTSACTGRMGLKYGFFFSMPCTLFPCHAQSLHLAAAGLGISLAQKGFLQARWWQRSAGLYASGEALSQIAFLQCGCSFKFITSASFCLRTGGSALGENNLIDFLVSANPELSCDLLTTTGLLFLIFGIVLRGFCLLAA